MTFDGWVQQRTLLTSANESCQGRCIGRDVKTGECLLTSPIRTSGTQQKKGELGGGTPPDARLARIDRLEDFHDWENNHVPKSSQKYYNVPRHIPEFGAQGQVTKVRQ